MKRIGFLFLLCGVGIQPLRAQLQKPVATVKIKTSVECQMCQKRIESFFKREPAVEYINVNYHNKIATLRYYTDRTNPAYLRTAIANLGYDADTVRANPEFYNKLPDCCKKGGMARLREKKRQGH